MLENFEFYSNVLIKNLIFLGILHEQLSPINKNRWTFQEGMEFEG